MMIAKELVTCPACDASYLGAVNKADNIARDVRCPRCRNRFSVDGFLGRLSDALRPVRVGLEPRTPAATAAKTAKVWSSR